MNRAVTAAVVLALASCHAAAAAAAVVVTSLASSTSVSWTVSNANGTIHNVAATVPGCIHTDLLEAGIIGEPNYGTNQQHHQRWIAGDNFTYTASTFLLPAALLGMRNVDLVLEGVDTVADIAFNGKPVLAATNMHRSYYVDVKGLAGPSANTLTASFTGPVPASSAAQASCAANDNNGKPLCGDAACACPAPWAGPSPDQLINNAYIRKEQQNFGWDFAPAVGTSGITKEPRLVGYEVALLRDVVIATAVGGGGGWTVSVSVRLWSTHGPSSASSKQATVTAAFPSDSFANSADAAGTTNVVVGVGETVATLTITVPANANIERWWPNGYGNQTLYPLIVTFTPAAAAHAASRNANGSTRMVPTLQSKLVQVGFRTIEINQPALPAGYGDGRLFQYVVNSQLIYARGSNWVPAQTLQTRVTSQILQRHFDAFRSLHYNLVRVWGGGVYATEEFLQMADAAGIIILHDFQFGDQYYPTNDAFLNNVAAEVRDNVWRMGSHASLGVWCGNNEMGLGYSGQNHNFFSAHAFYSKFYFATVLNNASAVDPNRAKISSTPALGNETAATPFNINSNIELRGDMHFYLPKPGNCWNVSRFPRPRMITEFGFNSWPSFLTMEPYLSTDGSDYSFNATVPASRQQHPPGQMENTVYVESNWLWPDKHPEKTALGYRDELWMTQVAAAECYTHVVEYFRSQTDEYVNTSYPGSLDGWAMLGGNAGVLFWQADDTWPGPSWSQIELGGDRFKVGHYAFQRAFHPILVAGRLDEDTQTLAIYFSRSDYSSLSTLNATLRLTAVKWAGGKAAPSAEYAVTLPVEHASAKLLQAPFDAVLSSTGCPSRTECVLLAEVLIPDRVPEQQGTAGAVQLIIASNKVYLSKLNEVTTMVANPGLAVTNIVKLSSNSNSNRVDGSAFSITVTAKQLPAAVVWLETKLPGRFSDNGMLMLLENSLQVQFFTDDATVTREQLAATLTIRSLVDAAHGYSSSNNQM